MKDKRIIGKYLDKINDETINCRESMLSKNFRMHADSMMLDANHIDRLAHHNKWTFCYHTVQQLKSYIKQLQQPIVNIDNTISTETYSEITYVLYCLGDLADELDL